MHKPLLTDKGYLLIEKQSEEELYTLMDDLGEIIDCTEVKVNLESKALVTSDCELDLHTDHSKANYIVWFCLKQTDIGGYSLLLDTRPVLAALSEEDKSALQHIHLYEHKVFADDLNSYPILSYNNGNAAVYYSFWLANDEDKKSRAFQRFKNRIDTSTKTILKMKPGDVLVVDNKRILHGRSQIEGTKERHLRRFWIR